MRTAVAGLSPVDIDLVFLLTDELLMLNLGKPSLFFTPGVFTSS